MLKKTGKIIIRYLPFLVMMGAAAWIALSGKEISIQTVLSYTPKAPILAAFFLIVLYGLKSLSIVFPLAVLFAAGGSLFPWPVACIINLAGLAVATSIPYWIGKHTGHQGVENLLRRYPKLGHIRTLLQGNDFFCSFIIRFLGILSCDVVSMYMGMMDISYTKYLFGGLLGYAPQMIAITLMGESITHPGTPEFIISLGITLISSFIAIFIYTFHLKRKKSQFKL